MPSDVLRLGVFGNSHAAALRSGRDLMRDDAALKAVDITFYALPDRYPSQVVDGYLQPATDDGRLSVRTNVARRQVELASIDAFVLVGLPHLHSKHLRSFIRTYRGEAHAPGPDNPRLLSDGCFETAMAGLIRRTEPWRLVQMVRMATKAPIALIPAPAPISSALANNEEGEIPILEVIDAAGAAEMKRSWHRAIDRLAGDDFLVLHQPPETLAAPMLSLRQYMKNVGHLNGDYGAIMLRACLAWARSLTGKTVDAS